MGCDIHMYIEKFTDEDHEGPKDLAEIRDNTIDSIIEEKSTIENRWVSADTWVWVEDYDEDEDGNLVGAWSVPYQKQLYHDRNYIIFSLLADVRNWNSNLVISEPKGIPEDASYGFKYASDRYGVDGHSHSYYTLKELQEVDFDKIIKESNVSSNNIEYVDMSVDRIKEMMEDMKKIESNPEHIRMCFFFDN